jgi:hypothetical protein
MLVARMASGQSISDHGPSQFDKFVLSPRIEWAQYIDDTIRFENPSLNKILAKRFEKNEIRSSLPVELNWNHRQPLAYTKKTKLDDQMLYPLCQLPIYDSMGNILKADREASKTNLDTAAFTLMGMTEILYVEDGKLRSYVPWANVKIPVTTNAGIFLGIATYFSTCFNLDPHYLSAAKNKIAFLKQTRKKVELDSIRNEYRLKEMYGKNIVAQLWPSVLKNSFEIISLKTNRKIKAAELRTDLVNDVITSVPVYDSLGNLAGSKIITDDLLPSNFTAIEFIQDWYYDYTRNIVFNKIKEIYLYAHITRADGLDKEVTPVLKIVLNK